MLNNELKPYLNFTLSDKSVANMLKLRTGNHTFSVEIDRYRIRKTYDECICNNCGEEKIEYLYHVAAECQKYANLRNDLDFLQNTNKSEFYAILQNINQAN